MSRLQRLGCLGIAVAVTGVAVILPAASGGDNDETANTGAQRRVDPDLC